MDNSQESIHQIFISWSGEYSRTIAEKLKEVLEEDVFSHAIKCFVSTQNIASGEAWYNKIKNELHQSSLGIVCITKENVKAPWLYFEAGALFGNSMRVIPLLVNCDSQSLDHSPFRANQSIQFYERDRFYKMLDDIAKLFCLLSNLKRAEVRKRYKTAYDKMNHDLKDVLDELKGRRYFSERYIYPPDIQTMDMNTVYISAPMSTLNGEEYEQQQEFLKELSKTLLSMQEFKHIVCPAVVIEQDKWQGITTAVNDNYSQLRQAQHLMVIYPKSVPTSALVEIGYGIALCKNTVIFYKEHLPYMLDGAAEDIPHLHTRQYQEYADIINAIITDRGLFKVGKDDQ